MTVDDHIEAIIDALDLEPRLVRTISIDLRTITATMYATTSDGHKFVRSDGNVATNTLTYPHKAFMERAAA